jgi:hypothetical protein
MGIPGFTAERSLAVARQGGGLVHRRRRVNSRAGISPAATNIGTIGHGCFNICGGDPDCIGECLTALGDGGGGGGLGSGGGGDLVCTKCRNGRHHCVLPGVGGAWSSCVPGDD